MSILQSPLQRKIPRFVFPGPGFLKRLNHFQGSSKANNKEPKPRSSCAVSCLHSPAEPPGVRLHSVFPGAAARRLQSWGMRANGEMHPQKSAPPSTGEPVSSRPPPLAAIAVKVAAAAGENSLEVHGVRLGDSAHQEGAKGRYGDSGCLGGPLFPSLAGCGGHQGPQQDRRCTRAFRTPPARLSTQHRPGSCLHWGARYTPRNQATTQTSRVASLTPCSWKLRRGCSGRPRVGVKERAGGIGCSRGSPELRWELQRLKFLLSRCLLSARQLVGFPLSPCCSGFPPSPARLGNL